MAFYLCFLLLFLFLFNFCSQLQLPPRCVCRVFQFVYFLIHATLQFLQTKFAFAFSVHSFLSIAIFHMPHLHIEAFWQPRPTGSCVTLWLLFSLLTSLTRFPFLWARNRSHLGSSCFLGSHLVSSCFPAPCWKSQSFETSENWQDDWRDCQALLKGKCE